MNRLLVLLIACVTLSAVANAQSQVATAVSILDSAVSEARKSDRKVFLIFHASWCGWCKKMDSAMNDSQCKGLLDKNYIITHLVVNESANKKHLEHPGGADILKKYDGAEMGLPYWVILNSRGERVADAQMRKGGLISSERGENAGCPASHEEVAHLKKVLAATSNLTEKEITIICNRFLQINAGRPAAAQRAVR